MGLPWGTYLGELRWTGPWVWLRQTTCHSQPIVKWYPKNLCSGWMNSVGFWSGSILTHSQSFLKAIKPYLEVDTRGCPLIPRNIETWLRATKRVSNLRNLSNQDRLRALNLHSKEHRQWKMNFLFSKYILTRRGHSNKNLFIYAAHQRCAVVHSGWRNFPKLRAEPSRIAHGTRFRGRSCKQEANERY